MNRPLAELLLRDLARWQFGQVLARRAGLVGADEEELAREVRAYRFGLIRLNWKDEALDEISWAQAYVGADQQALKEWSAFALHLEQNPESERLMAEAMMARLRTAFSLGAAEAPLARFARGKAFKYGARVRHLVGLWPENREAA